MDPKGWIWNRLGFRERYASHILMTALEVKRLITRCNMIAIRCTCISFASLVFLFDGFSKLSEVNGGRLLRTI